MQVLVEIQFQRVAFGHFAEQVEGGQINPRVGQEMDRFAKLADIAKGLESNRTPKQGGILSEMLIGLVNLPIETNGSKGAISVTSQEIGTKDPAALEAAYSQEL
jgi:hypothetical protein